MLISFSIASYFIFSGIAQRNLEYEDDQNLATIEQSIINKSIDRLENILLISDSGVIVLAAALGYYLAGKTLKPIKESLERQKRFVADSAHELRTPLAIMKTGIDITLASKKQTLKDYKELNQNLLNEIDNLINLTNNLLFLSNSDTKNQTVNFEKVDLSLICSKQIKFMEKYAINKEVKIISDIKDKYYVKGDKEKLNRMVANLLKNSIDYNIKGGSVILTIEKADFNIILKITDTGIGINQEDLKHVFERFYKADKSRSISDSGAGLGLSIVKEIANIHKIPIKIKSDIGKGTTVILSFKEL
ncbi:MAG: HAMP domain-containing histidine kinase [Cyanobacteria bacterium]|nr:HAMP domain-containing histidine kinase [Cyanobacteriota bacterium]